MKHRNMQYTEKKISMFWRFIEAYRVELSVVVLSSLGAVTISFAVKAFSFLSNSEMIFLDILLVIIVLIISMVVIISRKIDFIAEAIRAIGISNIQGTALLGPGSPWFHGAELVRELGAGDVLLASTMVPWPIESTDYINANKEAMKKGLVVKRLYANDDYNKDLAIKQFSWGPNLEGRIYMGKLPLMDYCLAIRRGQLEWAMFWIYAPGKPTLLYGLLIRDYHVLQSLKEDFDSKWMDSEPVRVDS